MANEWGDPSDLAGMSRSGDLLGKMGLDREAVMADPSMRAALMQKLGGPYSAIPPQQQGAAPQVLNPKSPNGNDISAPPGAPRLINRQEPTVPAPRPLPATLGGAPAPTPATMAGAAPPTSSSVSPSGTPTPSIETTNSRQAVGNLLAPEPDLPDTAKEDAMIAAKSMPINPNTSIGGKQIYKEGFLGKLGRIGKGAAIGFAGHPDDAVSINAPNDRFNLDDQTRQAQLGLANKQRADAIAAFKEKSDLRKQQDMASKDAGEISNTAAKLPNETTTANADMLRAQDAGNPKNEQEAIAAYGAEKDPTKKAALWDTVTRMHTATMQEKPPHNGPIPSAESQEFNAWTRAFPGTHGGKKPTAEDIEVYGRRSGKIDPDADAEVGSIVAQAMDAKQKYADALDPQPDGTYQDRNTGKIITGQQFQAQIDKLGRSDPNVKLAKKGYTIDENGQMVKFGDKAHASTPPPAGAPQQPGEVAIIAPDGTPGFIPESKLKKALAAGYKQPPGAK